MYLPITFILYGLCQCSPSYPSLQHVIGHKKLQLCINLLHWSLEGGRRSSSSKYRMESNRIEWKAKPSEWRTDGEDKHRHGALITTCHQILMSNPLARTAPPGQPGSFGLFPGGPRQGTTHTTSNKCCKRCKHNNL